MSEAQTRYEAFYIGQLRRDAFQETLKIRKAIIALPETGTTLGDHDMKPQNVRYEVRAFVSLTLSKPGTARLSKLIEEIAPICSIYDIGFRKVAEEYKAGKE